MAAVITFLLVVFVFVIPIVALARTFIIDKKYGDELKDLRERLQNLEAAKKPASRTSEAKAKTTPPARQAPANAPAPAAIPAPESVKKSATAVRAENLLSDEPVKTEKKPVKIAGGPGWIDSLKKFIKTVDLEQFTGVKLFAWLGGIALFVGAAFFVKYSIDNNIIPPAARLALGAAAGAGLIVYSLFIDRKKYAITSHILCAGGLGTLYAVVYAAANVFHYIPVTAGMVLMALVSASSFVLAVYLKGVSISALGAAGAYAMPVLLSGGQQSLLILFVYLALVNAGVFEVVRRMKSGGLFMLAAAGTAIVHGAAFFSMGIMSNGAQVAAVLAGNIAVFALFLVLMPPQIENTREVNRGALTVFYSALFFMLFLTPERSMLVPLFALTAALVSSALAYFKKERAAMLAPYNVAVMGLVIIWVITSFSASQNDFIYPVYLLYAVVLGFGPLIAVRKHGYKVFGLSWFAGMPVLAVITALIMIGKSPGAGILFWPMALLIQAAALFLSFMAGSIIGIIVVLIAAAAGGLAWVTGGHVTAVEPAFFVVVVLSGFGLVTAALAVSRYSARILKSEFFKIFRDDSLASEGRYPEWLSVMPALGAFIVLGASYLVKPGQPPGPGMAAASSFLALSVFLGRRIGSHKLIAAALASFTAAQACWMLRTGDSHILNAQMLGWAGALWVVSAAVSFIYFRPASKNRLVWQSWAAFELAQAFFIVKATEVILHPDISGWIPAVLLAVKIPVLRYLVIELEKRKERNSVLAFQGGAVLFYLTSVPILLLSKEWIGLTLIMQSTALLWMNRRISHPGLPPVSALLAAAGIVLLSHNFALLKGPDSLPVLNMAVASVFFSVVSLVFSARLAPGDLIAKSRVSYDSLFKWAAAGLGFYFANLVVADFFQLKYTAGKIEFMLFSATQAMQYISYTLLWCVCGAVLWSAGKNSKWLRLGGFLLFLAGWLRAVSWPYIYRPEAASDVPVLYSGMLIFIPLIIVIAWMLEVYRESESRLKPVLIIILAFTSILAAAHFSSALLQPAKQFGFIYGHGLYMSLASAFTWVLYGAGLFLWKRGLGRNFRIAGLVLIQAGLFRLLLLPEIFSQEFGTLPAFINALNPVFLICMAGLAVLALMKHGERWPLTGPVTARRFFGVTLAVFSFVVLNFWVVKFFGAPGEAFEFASRGRFGQQLAYSLGWLIYAMVLLWVGIHWDSARTRWAALILFSLTTLKIFLLDLWKLGQLYRVASLIGLAVVLILVSFLYQKVFMNAPKNKK